MATEALVLRDNYGSKVITERTQDGECLVSITNGLTCVMAVFTDEGFAELRELLDRAAMPGQVTARVYPCCKCCEREREMSGDGPCVPPHHLKPCAGGCDS